METRSVNQLLKLMLDNIDFIERNMCGLCDLKNMLSFSGKITIVEWCTLQDYFINNRPVGKNIMDHWWPHGELEPRIEWLEKHIELTNGN